MKTTLCTLFEGHYHYGVASLANSLLASGYDGELFAGYRGALADWITRHDAFDAATGRLRLSDAFTVCFVKLDTPVFFTYYKAAFMQRVLRELCPDCDTVAYIDPDIVVKCKWTYLESWFEGGIGLVEDVNGCLPPRHPKRLMWGAWFAEKGIHPVRELDRYYNAGFMSVPRQYEEFLVLLERMCDMVLAYNDGLKHIKSGDAPDLFHSTDQDAMNFALTVYPAPLNTCGPEAMDFTQGGYYFSHAIGYSKPWLGGHFMQALRGYPPSAAAKAYYLYANSPVQVHGKAKFALRRLSISAASAIGRFYRKI